MPFLPKSFINLEKIAPILIQNAFMPLSQKYFNSDFNASSFLRCFFLFYFIHSAKDEQCTHLKVK